MNKLPRFLALMVIPCLISQAHAQTSKYGDVTVAGVSIQNLDQLEATRRLKRELDSKLDLPITLALGPNKLTRRRRELGFSIDISRILTRAGRGETKIPVLFHVDAATLSPALQRLSPNLSSKSRDAFPVLTGEKVTIRPEITGRELNPSKSAAKVKILVEKDPTVTRIVLHGEEDKPRVTATQLKGINGVIASHRTRFNPGQVERTQNMRVAIESIDGMVLAPNAVFSLNKTVGERTKARGYGTAIIFADGKKKPGLGGGVSQVTGTLFNVALRASLPIVTYRTHSRPVAYLPLGRDATVAWGSFDMKFKNDTGAPVYISYKIRGTRVIATLLGKTTGKEVTLRVTSKRNGPRDISASLFRTIRLNGKVVKKEKVGTSHYKWKNDDEE